MTWLLLLDASLSRRFSAIPQASWGRVAHLGDGPNVFGLLFVGYLVGWLVSDSALSAAMLITTVVVSLTMVCVTFIKFIIRRQRPQPPGGFVAFRYDQYSFPSGHSARMAAMATSLLTFYLSLGIVLMIIAVSVALARVIVGVHYLGDILVGFCLGVLIAWASLLSVGSLLF